MGKIIDCITFFNENFIFDLRYKILESFVDEFIICESKYDHRGKEKKLNFKENQYNKKKINYIILDKRFPTKNNIWQNQATQRDYIIKKLDYLDKDDYIFFSDPDEIINPNILKNFELNKKYGIFMQKCFNYKFNLFNPYESPWEGTRVCKKKNLKSIDFMRQKIKSKNLNYNFYRIDKEKNIQIFNDAGWHFNNILRPEEIALKLKTFAHSEFSDQKFSSTKVIEDKIEKKIDLFERGHQYLKVEIDSTYPKQIRENKNQFKEFII
ncbi:glycosyl transferase family 17 [Candidatus Pelagibacter sp.]|jgi:beta-1,4-mannosyl-glycoprotein beta-1,4-N-acetylglucosaminyltransferase|nr:glycosyl transferase family 17 [Candidatus Pelagibacter sp.]